jgi:D-alanine-D-alanine ligase
MDLIHEFSAKRWILKSLWEHASIGLDARSVITTTRVATILRELESRLDRLGGVGFAEEYIDGREFNISLLGRGEQVDPGVWMPQVLPPAEIVFHDGSADGWGSRPRIVNYDCKWNEASFEYQHTQRVFKFVEDDQPLLEQMIQTARACWVIFELRGYARVDFRVDATGKPWVLEVNTNPCLSPDAGFAFALAQGKVAYSRAIACILEDSLQAARVESR